MYSPLPQIGEISWDRDKERKKDKEKTTNATTDKQDIDK